MNWISTYVAVMLRVLPLQTWVELSLYRKRFSLVVLTRTPTICCHPSWGSFVPVIRAQDMERQSCRDVAMAVDSEQGMEYG